MLRVHVKQYILIGSFTDDTYLYSQHDSQQDYSTYERNSAWLQLLSLIFLSRESYIGFTKEDADDEWQD